MGVNQSLACSQANERDSHGFLQGFLRSSILGSHATFHQPSWWRVTQSCGGTLAEIFAGEGKEVTFVDRSTDSWAVRISWDFALNSPFFFFSLFFFFVRYSTRCLNNKYKKSGPKKHVLTIKIACEFSRLSFAPATTCETRLSSRFTRSRGSEWEAVAFAGC